MLRLTCLPFKTSFPPFLHFRASKCPTNMPSKHICRIRFRIRIFPKIYFRLFRVFLFGTIFLSRIQLFRIYPERKKATARYVFYIYEWLTLLLTQFPGIGILYFIIGFILNVDFMSNDRTGYRRAVHVDAKRCEDEVREDFDLLTTDLAFSIDPLYCGLFFFRNFTFPDLSKSFIFDCTPKFGLTFQLKEAVDLCKTNHLRLTVHF